MKVKWTDEEIKLLKECYPSKDKEYIINLLNRSWKSITRKAENLKLRRNVSNLKYEEENNILIKYYPIMSNKELINTYFEHMSINTLKTRARKLELVKSKNYKRKCMQKVTRVNSWTKEDDEYLINNYSNKTKEEIMSNINNRTWESIKARGQKLGLKRDLHPWSEEEIELLKKYYPIMRNSEVHEKYLNNRSVCNIDTKAKSIGLEKDKDYLKSMKLENLIKINSKNYKKYSTKPQRIVNDILNKLNIEYENEYNCRFYLVDNYIIKYNLMIEVQGDYFHCNPNFNFSYGKMSKSSILRKDSAKHTYIKNKYGIEVLYLWEHDIIKNKILCEELIKEYINNNGKLKNYHSFNYYFDGKNINLNNEIIDFNY